MKYTEMELFNPVYLVYNLLQNADKLCIMKIKSGKCDHIVSMQLSYIRILDENNGWRICDEASGGKNPP